MSEDREKASQTSQPAETAEQAPQEPTTAQAQADVEHQAAAEQAQADAEQAQADESAVQQQTQAEVDVFDVLRMALGLFAQEAWIGLGVQARPGASETKTDLRCARVAIDMVQVIADKLAPEADENERRTINQLLTDLRVNFVRVSSHIKEQN